MILTYNEMKKRINTTQIFRENLFILKSNLDLICEILFELTYNINLYINQIDYYDTIKKCTNKINIITKEIKKRRSE